MAAAIANYTPDIPAHEWAVIGEFVRAAVRDCMGKTVYSPRQLFAAATRHVRWCWATAGLPLDNAVVFHPQIICEFIDAGCPEWSRPTAGNHRARLMRMSEILMPPGKRPVRLPVIEPSSPLQPYTVAEQVALRSWATGQVTQYRVVNCHVLLSLGLGAGLTAAEVWDVRVRHLHVDSVGVLVEVVGKRGRLVPVLAEWETVLVDLAGAGMDPDMHVFRPQRSSGYTKNSVGNFVAKTDAGRVVPTQQRMRATWLVTHLRAGSPVKALVQAAGLDSLESLTRYLRYVPDADPAALRAAFRNAEVRP